ncbi:type I glutamate--ammonia ligase [Dehalococcoidia bacterium]|nr:type I glutamate--ammonia ligase [Dehalococcoidia bacterium]
MSTSSPKEVLELCNAQGIRIVDVKFTDLLGTMQHFSVTTAEFDESTFEKGLGFDGSSIRGFQHIHQSDMLLLPDPATAYVDPIYKVPTLSITANIVDPLTRDRYNKDPRYVAEKAEAYLQETGLADTSFWGPEIEFFIFDDVRYDQNAHESYYFVDSQEGIWNTGDGVEGNNLGYRPRHKEGYFPVPPIDTLQDLRSEIVLAMQDLGVHMEVHHHEVATAGQGEIDLRYQTLQKAADQVVLLKYIARNIVNDAGKTITFMPKPLYGDNGTGMHTHQSLWKGGKNQFFDPKGYGGISQMCKYYIGGLLKHSASVLAFSAPTTNSYKRLVPGFEAPVNLAYSARNRSACIRIPMYSNDERSKRLEYRPPDVTANPYLAFPAMLMAGLDGIMNKIDPGDPLEQDIYELPPEEAAGIATVPGSLEEALNALEKDHEFLLRGNVFTSDLVETWLDYKRTKEVDAMRLRTHPYEFFLYYDA